MGLVTWLCPGLAFTLMSKLKFQLIFCLTQWVLVTCAQRIEFGFRERVFDEYAEKIGKMFSIGTTYLNGKYLWSASFSPPMSLVLSGIVEWLWAPVNTWDSCCYRSPHCDPADYSYWNYDDRTGTADSKFSTHDYILKGIFFFHSALWNFLCRVNNSPEYEVLIVSTKAALWEYGGCL